MLWPHLLPPWPWLPDQEDEPDILPLTRVQAEPWAEGPYRFSIAFTNQAPPAQAKPWTLAVSNPGGGVLHLEFQAQHLTTLHGLALPPTTDNGPPGAGYAPPCRQLFWPPAFALAPCQERVTEMAVPQGELCAGPTLCQTLPWHWERWGYQVVLRFAELHPAARLALGNADVLITDNLALAGWVFGSGLGRGLAQRWEDPIPL